MLLAGLNNRKPIVYNVNPLGHGFQIQAVLPRRVDPNDRVKVIDWFRDYRVQVHNLNPYWVTMFHVNGNTYALDVIQADGPRQLVERAIPSGPHWQQLSFDYGGY